MGKDRYLAAMQVIQKILRLISVSSSTSSTTLTSIETNTGNSATSLAILDDWDSTDACKTVGITDVVKITGANVGVDGAAYAANDVLGDKAPIATAMVRASGGTAILQSITVQDLSKQDIGLDILLFDANPSGSTFTDNAAVDVADADLPKLIGVVSVAAADYVDFADSSVATVRNIGLPLLAVGSANIYVVLVTRGAPTYVADELSIVFGLLQD